MKVLFSLTILICIVSCKPIEKKKVEDVIVIGGGLMGSSTAWQLSKYGEKVFLLEQQDSIYTHGSSFGEARISRSLGPKGDIFSYLQQTSVKETEGLIEFLNQGNVGPSHSMDDIYSTSPVTYIFHESQIGEVNAILDGQSDKYEYAPNSEKAMELFGMKIPDTCMVMREYKKYSGTLNPKVLIAKLHEGIKKQGNSVKYNYKVIKLSRGEEFYEIEVLNKKTGEEELLKAKNIIAAAGPYNGQLVKDIAPYFEKLITPKRLFLAFLKIKTEAYNKLIDKQKEKIRDFYPVAYLNSEIFYSMIEKFEDNGEPLLKVGGHFLRTDIDDLDAVWQKELTVREIEWSKNNTIFHLKSLNLPLTKDDLEYISGYSCIYSLTNSEIPYVTNIIKEDNEIDPNIVLVGGMSGVGAKGSLAYGLIAADLILKKSDTSEMYHKTKKALGTDRLYEDIISVEQ